MNETLTVTVDGIKIEVDKGSTILEAAEKAGIEIPIICYHDNLKANGLCRLCSVEVGWRVMPAACVTQCNNGMEISTNTVDVINARRTILELLASTVNLDEAPGILGLIENTSADISRFSQFKTRNAPFYDDNPFFQRDYGQCINCWRCVQVCGEDAQYAFALSFEGRGFGTIITTFMDKPLMNTTCVFCGQCVGVCPTGALKPKRQSLMEAGSDPDEIFFKTIPKYKNQKQ